MLLLVPIKIGEWVLDYQVIDIITALYNNVTTTWAQHNRNDAFLLDHLSVKQLFSTLDISMNLLQ